MLWSSLISPNVFTKLKTDGNALLTKYPDISFTTVDRVVSSNAKFPTVYVHEMAGAEQGADLEGQNINAVISSFQIEVIDNTSQNRTNEVMTEIVGIMKSMRYQVIATPEFQNTATVYRSVARFRRVVAKGDKLVTNN